jgi:hypothetical protein
LCRIEEHLHADNFSIKTGGMHTKIRPLCRRKTKKVEPKQYQKERKIIIGRIGMEVMEGLEDLETEGRKKQDCIAVP